MIKKAGWFLFCVLMTASCLEEPDCFSLNNNIIGIAFKRISTRLADTVFVNSITAAGTDSIFVDNGGTTALTKVDLPLNFYEQNTDFVLHTPDGDYDLLTNYSAKAQLVSEDCGERYVLSDLQVTAPAFDSIRILNRSPKRSTQTGTTVEIYRCPVTNVVRFKLLSSVELVNVTGGSGRIYSFSKNSATYVAVPLNAADSQATITFSFKDSAPKTITLSYSRAPKTLYTMCGEQVILHDLEGTASDFSSTTILNDSIQDNGIPNIAITY